MPPADLQLHFDVQRGARADSLIAALLHAGADVDAMRASLAHFGVAPQPTTRVRVSGVNALTYATLAPSAARDDVRHPQHPPVPSRAAKASRQPRRITRTSGQPAPAPADAVAIAAPPPGSSEAAAATTAPAGPRERDDVSFADWLAGASVRPRDLPVLLRQSALPPVVKALALRTVTRMVEAYGAVRGDVDSAVWRGQRAAQLTIDVVSVCALVDALAPSRISASSLLVSNVAGIDEGIGDGMVPCPWLMQILAGITVHEAALSTAPTDVTAAALVVTLARHVGTRPSWVPYAQGFGAATDHDALVPVLTRIALGRAPPHETASSAAVRLSADVQPAEMSTCKQRLLALGALHTRTDVSGHICAVVNLTQLQDATRALWQAGAQNVAREAVSIDTPQSRQVTVAVRRGSKAVPVRVAVSVDPAGEVLWVGCIAADVAQAAQLTGRAEGLVRAEALQAWARLQPAQEVIDDD